LGVATHLPTQDSLEQIAGETPDLDLLLVFGSRARGEARDGSDWDFGYLAGPAFDPDDLLARLVLALGDDRIDLVDLSRASGLLRYRAAADGRPLFESREHAFEDFWFEAASFWCDVQPVVRDAYEGVLERLSP
jgi:predicted nucleotidyltransferase